jgi:FRG domain
MVERNGRPSAGNSVSNSAGSLWHRPPRLLQHGLALTLREWMAVAQHYGVPTDFLDFSYNAEVAAYFATLSNDGEIGVIYCFNYAYAEQERVNYLPTATP